MNQQYFDFLHIPAREYMVPNMLDIMATEWVIL